MSLEGADRVNDELEVGFDESFERNWHYAELAGRAVMVVAVVAGLLGLLGRGPYSHRALTDVSGRIAIDYEPVARNGTATQITLHLHNAVDGIQRLTLDGHLVELFGLSSIMPLPLGESASGSGVKLSFAPPDRGRDLEVRLTGMPRQVGQIDLALQTAEGQTLRWSQFILP